MLEFEKVISAIQAIDFQEVLERNPSRPFNNQLTLELYREEIIKSIRELDNQD